MFGQDHIHEMLDTVERWLPRDRHDFEYQTPGTFFPQATKLLWSLVGRGEAVGKKVCFHPLLVALRDELLHMRITRTNDASSEDMQTKYTEIPPRLSLSVCFDMRPGGKQQPLHRDEDVWGTTHERPFRRDDIRQLGVLIAGTRSVKENGATLVVPGSHLWDDERVPRLEEACYAGKGHPLECCSCANLEQKWNLARRFYFYHLLDTQAAPILSKILTIRSHVV